MGATGWRYTTAYDPDPKVALRRLRQEAFETGDYLAPGGILPFSRGSNAVSSLPLRMQFLLVVLRTVSAVATAIHWLARGGRQPRSIDELLAMARENGTHSILDITHTSDIPEFGAATLLSKRAHLECFGTLTPTRAQVDAALTARDGELGDRIRRWQAVYFIAHDEDGTPVDYVFLGASGD